MEQKFKKDSWQWKFFQEYWKFVQAYYIPEAADEWWEEVRVIGRELYLKYKNDFVRDLIIDFQNDTDKRYKAGKEKS